MISTSAPILHDYCQNSMHFFMAELAENEWKKAISKIS